MSIFSIGIDDVDALSAYIKEHTDDELREELLPDGGLPESLEDDELEVYHVVILRLKEMQRGKLARELFKVITPESQTSRTIEDVEAELEDARAIGDVDKVAELEAEIEFMRSQPHASEETAKQAATDAKTEGLTARAARIAASKEFEVYDDAASLLNKYPRLPSGQVLKLVQQAKADEYEDNLDELDERLSIIEPVTAPKAAIPFLAWYGATSLLVAGGKCGKTTLLTQAIGSMFEVNPGDEVQPWCGDQPPEMPQSMLVVIEKNRHLLSAYFNQLVPVKGNKSADRVMVTRNGSVSGLKQRVERYRPEVVIIDSLTYFASRNRVDLWTPGAIRELIEENIRKVVGDSCAVLLVHHTRKSDGTARDSSDIINAVDMVVSMTGEGGKPLTTKPASPKRELHYEGRWNQDVVRLTAKDELYCLDEGPVPNSVDEAKQLEAQVYDYAKAHPGLPVGDFKREFRQTHGTTFRKLSDVMKHMVSVKMLTMIPNGENRNSLLVYPGDVMPFGGPDD